MKKILIPSLCVIKYTGELPRKVVEVAVSRREKPPVLENGDYLVVAVAIGMMMAAKRPYFEMVKGEELDAVLSFEYEVPVIEDDETKMPEGAEQTDVSKTDPIDLAAIDLPGDNEETGSSADDDVTGDGGENTVVSKDETAKAAETPELREATKVNVMELNVKEVKAACKKHGITIGNKKQDDLVALLLPYLS